MDELLFIILNGFFGLVVTIISLRKDFRDKRFTRQVFKQLKTEGYILLVTALLIIGLSIWQYIFQQRKTANEKKSEVESNIQRDSTIKAEISKGVTDNRKELFSDLSQALSKQMLKLDTVNKKFDSLNNRKTSVNVYNPEPVPILELNKQTPLTFTQKPEGLLDILVNIVCINANAAEVRLKISLVYSTGPETWDYVGKSDFNNGNASWTQNTQISSTFHISSDTIPSQFIVWVRGDFKDEFGRKKHLIDDMSYYIPKTKRFGVIVMPDKPVLINFITSKEL